MTTQNCETYDMTEDAIGLADFITKAIETHIPRDEAPVVYVYDAQGEMVTTATLERETLTDGSHVYNLRLGIA